MEALRIENEQKLLDMKAEYEFKIEELMKNQNTFQLENSEEDEERISLVLSVGTLKMKLKNLEKAADQH